VVAAKEAVAVAKTTEHTAKNRVRIVIPLNAEFYLELLRAVACNENPFSACKNK
jgi:hypothetical protein